MKTRCPNPKHTRTETSFRAVKSGPRKPKKAADPVKVASVKRQSDLVKEELNKIGFQSQSGSENEHQSGIATGSENDWGGVHEDEASQPAPYSKPPRQWSGAVLESRKVGKNRHNKSANLQKHVESKAAKTGLSRFDVLAEVASVFQEEASREIARIDKSRSHDPKWRTRYYANDKDHDVGKMSPRSAEKISMRRARGSETKKQKKLDGQESKRAHLSSEGAM